MRRSTHGDLILNTKVVVLWEAPGQSWTRAGEGTIVAIVVVVLRADRRSPRDFRWLRRKNSGLELEAMMREGRLGRKLVFGSF
jgi:hypothetical protein